MEVVKECEEVANIFLCYNLHMLLINFKRYGLVFCFFELGNYIGFYNNLPFFSELFDHCCVF